MLQFTIAAACCTIFLISCAAEESTISPEDARWSRQASAERERRIDDWVPIIGEQSKRAIIGEQRPGQPDDISSLLTPPAFAKPRHIPIESQNAFFPPSLAPKGPNSPQFSPNRPFALRQTSGSQNFQQPSNQFIQEPKSQQFFSNPPQQSFSFPQQQFFLPPQQSHFPIPNQPRPQFDFIQPPALNGRPQALPPQFNNRLPPKTNTFPGVVTPVQIGQSEKEEVQLLYVPVETLQKNKLKDSRPFGKQSSEKAPSFQVSPTSQSVIKDQRFNFPPPELNQREPKQNFNSVPPQFGGPSSFQFQQIGDSKFNTVFEQNFRHPGVQSFSPAQAPPPPAFIRNENPNRFEFSQQQTAVPSNEIRQTTPTFNQFVSQTSSPTFGNQVPFTPSVPVPSLPPNPPPHQPPLAVYMERNENSKVTDVLSVLKSAKTIPVLDQVEDQSPLVFVGPSSLEPPKGYVKFDLPYLSSIESNRIERKITSLPFFVAPLNFKPPPGYSKVPFPAPHIGSVVISNSTVFREALERPTTPKYFPQQETLPSSPSFFQESQFNEIPSTTSLPANYKQSTTASSFETNPTTFETNRPQFDFNEQQFTRKPTVETVQSFEVPNVRYTQPPAEIRPQFVEKQPILNENQPQSFEGKQQFQSQQQFTPEQRPVQQQFTPEQRPVQPQFSVGTPPSDVQQPQFNEVPSQFDSQPKQSSAAIPETTPANVQFETQPPQFEGQQITYQFEKDQIQTNALREQEFLNQKRPEFTNVRQPEFINQRDQGLFNQKPQEFSNQRQPEFTDERQQEFLNPRPQDFSNQVSQEFTTQPKAPFEPQNTFEVNQAQINNEQAVRSDYNPQYDVIKEQNYNQQTNEFATQANDARVPSQQYEATTEAPVQTESTTVYIPRRRTTTPKQLPHKSSTPPPNYNPRRNRRPLYRGMPKNSGQIQSTTLGSFNVDSIEPERTQNNQIGTRFEETYTNRIESNYPTVKPRKEYQSASETYYQPEIENTIGPVFEQKSTENYPQTEKVESPTTTYTQQTPNYSNFQGINQFFNQVIQKENNFVPQEKTTVPVEAFTTLPPRIEQTFYTEQPIAIEASQSPVYSENTPQTEATTAQQTVAATEEYTKRPHFSGKGHRYRQKLQNTQNTVNTYENTPVYDSTQKSETSETEKPLRKKGYRQRQRPGGRGQYRTSTSTETVVDENIPSHFSSIRGQNDVNNQVIENLESQATTTEHASTKIDVGKYGTFKRRRPIKAYERTTTEASNLEQETTTPVSTTRSYRPRARPTTGSPGERVTRNRLRKTSTSTTETVSEATRVEENPSVDWGSYVSSFNPSAQANDVLGNLEDQNKISKTEENAIDQFSIQKSQSYELTSPASNIDTSQSFGVTASDQSSYSTNDQGSVSQFENRKFSAKKLHSGFTESDNTYQDSPITNVDSQLDSINGRNNGFRSDENYPPSNVEDKSLLDKPTEEKKAYDPTTGKKIGGRRRGQWVRVRVKKPNQEPFETAESQNVANFGNAVQNPTKPSLIRLSSEEFARLQSENKGLADPERFNSDQVYFTSTTERISTTTTEDSPSKFDLEKGVSAMIAEFMNGEDDESNDNAQEVFETVEVKQPANHREETSLENQQVSQSQSADSLENLNNSDSGLRESVQGPSDVLSASNVSNNEQNVEKPNPIEEFQNVNHFSPIPAELQTQYHENYNEESEQKESQLKEREIKHEVKENSHYEFSNHKYDDKEYVLESETKENVKKEEQAEEKEEISQTTVIPVTYVDSKVQDNTKETVITEAPEITTSSPDSEVITEEYDVTTEPSIAISEVTQSKVVGTSTTTEISMETEICYKGRCIKSKKKRPVYKDLIPA